MSQENEVVEGTIRDEAIVVTGGDASPPAELPETPPSGEATPAPETPPEGEKDAEEAAAKRARGTDRLNKRFAELTRTIHEERAARAAVEQRLRDMESRGQPPQGQQPPSDGAPNIEQFQSYEEYADARARYVARQEFQAQARARAEAQARESATSRAVEIRANWETAEAAFRDKVEDYDEVMADPSVKFSESASLALLDSDKGPELAYYLKKNPEEAHALANASPVAAARIIGKLEAKLSAAPPPQPQATRTPPPPTPIRAASAGDGLSDNLSVRDWIEKRNQQILNRRR